MSTIGDEIVECALKTFRALPPKAKPHTRSNGRREWTCYAAIVLSNPLTSELECVAAGSGVKCLPLEGISLHGDTLHDSHAEVLTRRAFNLWVRTQLEKLAQNPSSLPSSYWFVPTDSNSDSKDSHWKLNPIVKVHLYISTLPCGDASMASLALAQDPQEAELYDSLSHNDNPSSSHAALLGENVSRGRKGYHHHGRLRTKPARADAPLSTSLSCTDKIALWSFIGLQDSLLCAFVDPIYLSSIILSNVPTHRQSQVRDECLTALHQRFLNHETLQQLNGPYKATEPEILFTKHQFEYSKEMQSQNNDNNPEAVPSADSFNFVQGLGVEVLTDGKRKGSPSPKLPPLGSDASVKDKQKRIPPLKSSARSRLCKINIFKRHQIFCKDSKLHDDNLSYYQAKHFEQNKYIIQHSRSKNLLKGSNGPFQGWLRNDPEIESFRL